MTKIPADLTRSLLENENKKEITQKYDVCMLYTEYKNTQRQCHVVEIGLAPYRNSDKPVFGRVVDQNSMEQIDYLNGLGASGENKYSSSIQVTDCGVIPLKTQINTVLPAIT